MTASINRMQRLDQQEPTGRGRTGEVVADRVWQRVAIGGVGLPRSDYGDQKVRGSSPFGRAAGKEPFRETEMVPFPSRTAAKYSSDHAVSVPFIRSPRRFNASRVCFELTLV
jgi:hypothetical protein